MAGFVSPMLATLGSISTFEGGDEWAYEKKWDGIRAIAAVEDRTVKLWTRNGREVTTTYPEVAKSLTIAVTEGNATLDGEIVALDAHGQPSFQLLQQRMGLTKPADIASALHRVPLVYYVFDILDDPAAPYVRRREMLAAKVRDVQSVIVPPDAGNDLLQALSDTKRQGLEGVMAKRRNGVYQAGIRSRDWIKLKHRKSQEVVVVGWRPGTGKNASTLGSLMIAVPDPTGELRYVGNVGTGFSDGERDSIVSALTKELPATSNLAGLPADELRNTHLVIGRLVGEVEYAELTRDGRLRQASWRGWRVDKTPSEVTMEVPSLITGAG